MKTLPNSISNEMKWRLLDGVKRFADRDIVSVMLDDGTVQPFYKSTGRNSHQPGVWFPFDGLMPYCHPVQGWFIKNRFGYDRLGRSEFYASISQALSLMEIPDGVEVGRTRAGLDSINMWLGNEGYGPAIDCQQLEAA